MERDRDFATSIASIYDQYLVPLIFSEYAVDLAARVASLAPERILEVAAGTGAVTRELARRTTGEIVATDLNAPMLDHAARIGTSRPVTYRTADALALPFPDGAFDAVACQFGAMFFPDRARAFAEFRRVLRRGGILAFNVWDRIELNEFADEVTRAVEALLPGEPRRFLARIPHGYHDLAIVRADLAAGEFTTTPDIQSIALRSRADSARIPAIAYVQGTPLCNAIDPARLAEATDVATAAIARRFGDGPVDGMIAAHVIVVTA